MRKGRWRWWRVSCCACRFSGSRFSRCHRCRTPQRQASWFHSLTAFHHTYEILGATFFPSGCCSPIVFCHRLLLSVSQILAYFTLRKRIFGGVVLTPPVGYSRPSSAVNDPSVTKLNEFMKAIRLRFSPKFCKERVAPCDRKPLLAASYLTFFGFSGRPPGFSPLPPGGGRTRCGSRVVFFQ